MSIDKEDIFYHNIYEFLRLYHTELYEYFKDDINRNIKFSSRYQPDDWIANRFMNTFGIKNRKIHDIKIILDSLSDDEIIGYFKL